MAPVEEAGGVVREAVWRNRSPDSPTQAGNSLVRMAERHLPEAEVLVVAEALGLGDKAEARSNTKASLARITETTLVFRR